METTSQRLGVWSEIMSAKWILASLAAVVASALVASPWNRDPKAVGRTESPDLSLAQGAPMAEGVVFEDRNRNGRRDPGERGIAGVRVSNQRVFDTTDSQGRWRLPYDDDTIFFVVKPAGYMTPVDEQQLPKFYYVHKPSGSPKTRFGGVEPTGPLPKNIEFALYKTKEPAKFQALFFGDTQSRNIREIDYLTRTIIEPLRGSDAAFGVTLGDILFDDLSIFQQHNEAIALIGIPWYNVLGNHDINYDAVHDHESDETFHRFYGPNYYSFEYGKAHFVALDNVWWMHGTTQSDGRGRYKGSIGVRQLEWLKKDLALVPQDRLVVLTMHIPLMDTEEKKEILELLSQRPYTLSVAAHTHFQQHHFLGEEHGHKGKKPHHHLVNVTTCGSWWQGSPDNYGIPHSTMRDGAPRGYSIFTFDGNQYSIEFRAAGKPAAHQMNIYLPDEVKSVDVAKTDVLVNVFGGSEKSKVEMRFGEKGQWIEMTRTPMKDPAYEAMVEKDRALTTPFRPLPGAIDSPHIWRAKLPAFSGTGVQPVHVRTTDMFGQVYLATRGIRVVP